MERFGMRIDVVYPEQDLIKEMTQLNIKMQMDNSPLHSLPASTTPFEHLVFKTRVADGDTYIYFIDQRTQMIIAYFVFNRLVELSKRADKVLRSPHSKVMADYRGQGLANFIYRYQLDHGQCLISGARQSTGANVIWNKLSTDYPFFLVDADNKQLRYIEANEDVDISNRHIRRVLLGKGWTMSAFANQANLLNVPS